ncbi:HmuY protein [Pseudarcicella hirudinis]|uniref:HmuY protein n=1 Tax=Pseudarcicella hirudinis TaxID=1079859 RepID=A0A1I5YW86_9BACT|nr:HmuY family protein [Pseudarcicella hirudinis]SFQ48472.1 HmuY protein [Pseudarcicella hirudinis]
MNRLINRIFLVFCVVAIAACKKDEPALPDNLLAFGAATQGFDGEETTIKLSLSRNADAAVPVTISLTPAILTYGKEFTTEPAAVSNTLTVTVPAGQSSVSFKVKKAANVFLNGDESIQFKIQTVGTPVLKGLNTDLKLSFAAITSTGSKLTLEGKTAESNYTNTVFADLSANAQTPVNRKSWNLGFYNGSAFRVILNPGYQSSAVPTTKTDIAAVTLADAETVANLDFSPGGDGTLALVDYWDGDLTKTVFAEVSATESENKVYLVSFEGSKTKDKWFKVKVSRSTAGGYKVQYARIGETAIKTIEIAKNADMNFSFLSLENAATVAVEPRKTSWDIAWGYSTSNAGTTPPTPYWFQDFVLLNSVGGAEAAEVLESSVTYDAFAKANVAAQTFSKSRDAIGSKWRVTSGATLGIRRDRFYVVKDPQGNIYKLRFVSMGIGSDGGERGKPVIEYALVK